jgi:hypothetical protein
LPRSSAEKLGHAGTRRAGHREPALGAPPQHVVGCHGPFVALQITDLALGKLCPEVFAKVGRRACIGENGAFYMRFDEARGKLVRRFVASDDERERMRERIGAIGARIVAAVPGSALASDQHYRETDLAIDYREDVAPLSVVDVDRIVALMQAEGMTAKVSSIHVNGWFGDYDKLAMTKTLMREVFALDLDAARDACVFAGDSPNDAPMFAFFPNAVGVANVRPFLDRIATPPTWITARAAGAGFAELADLLLAND